MSVIHQVSYASCYLNVVVECKYLTRALVNCTYDPQKSAAITCGIQPTGVVTMAMKVLHTVNRESFAGLHFHRHFRGF